MDFGSRISDFFRTSDFGFRISITEEDRLPALRPPHDLLLPDFWEQYGVWVVIGGVFLLLLAAVAIWLLLRPRPSVIIPAETQARRALEVLRPEPETGLVLSKISQVIRKYFSAVFRLPDSELTTAEFCRALNDAPEPGVELKTQVCEFLRRTDERKFSPAPSPGTVPTREGPDALPPVGAVFQACKLIAEAEMRRAQLRAATQARTP